MELAKFKVIQKSIDYHEELKEDHYEVFIEYVQDKINDIRKKFKLIEITFGQDKIEIRGTKSNIEKFTKIPKDDEKEKKVENSLRYLITDFNQFQVSSKIVKLNETKFKACRDFPGIFYTPSILNNIKKIEIEKLINTKSSDCYKFDVFTSKTIQSLISRYLTLCTEVTCGLGNDDTESLSLKVETIRLIETILSGNLSKDEGEATDEKDDGEQKYVYYKISDKNNAEPILNRVIVKELEKYYKIKSYPIEALRENPKKLDQNIVNKSITKKIGNLVFRKFNI